MLLKRQDTITKDYDCIIIGSGLAGMTAALYATRYGLKTLLLERLMTGGGSSSSIKDIDTARATGARALAVTSVRRSRTVLTHHAPRQLSDRIAEGEHYLLGI